VTHEFQTDRLPQALRQMPVPPLRPGFADEALARASQAYETEVGHSRLARWDIWLSAALGGAIATLLTVLVMRPDAAVPDAGITLAMNESRNVEVLIDSERTLDDALIRISTTGAVALDGFDDQRSAQWRTRLERGRNVLSLPVVARSSGPAQLVAVIEHGGRTRKVGVNLVVKPPKRNEVA
jgi:hypothetical protein